jgi:osmotically-inducible protein OsmY
MIGFKQRTSGDEKRGLHRATHRLPGIAGTAELRLRSSSYQALKAITCEYHDGVLILEGSVPSFYQKQVAQELVASLGGVQQIDNRLVVQSAIRSPMDQD